MRVAPEVLAAKARLGRGAPSDVTAATSLLRDAAGRGIAEAHGLLATLAAAGIGQPQSWSVAIEHLRRASEAGSLDAREQLRVLGASNSDPLTPWETPAEKRVLNASPRIVAIDSFIGAEACDWLARRSAKRLVPSTIITSAGVTHSRARSNSAFEMSLVDCDVIVLLLRMRIAATIGVPLGALENAQVLHYAVGERFTPHHDYLDPAGPNVAAAGQRFASFLVYLNDGYEGGQTDFPQLGIRHQGLAGGALYFANILPSGALDPRSLHAGLPPRSGEKWLFSQWVRDRARV